MVSSMTPVGGVFALAVYTILFLKLYSYKDVNKWCREIRQAEARTLARSQSFPYTRHFSFEIACATVSQRESPRYERSEH
ncbi:UNVERIFIED_CONTAM: hypothetical protein FKN15_040049 [Acipenser sinensis]